MDQTSITAAGVIDTFLVLLIGIGPKVALVPFLEIPGRARLPAAGQVARIQVPSRRVSPRAARLRRFSAAVRRLGQAWFLVTPR